MEPVTITERVVGGGKLFEPTYLNIEYLFYLVYQLFVGIGDWWREYGVIIKIICILLSIVFLFFIIYFVRKINAVAAAQDKKLEDEYYAATEYERTVAIDAYAKGNEKQALVVKRWNHAVSHLESENENDWRFAIIDADNMLEDLMREEGYSGANLGEMLKAAKLGDFVTLDKAWAAHKVRNDIAHGGSNFHLSRRLATETMRNFEKVFREFDYI